MKFSVEESMVESCRFWIEIDFNRFKLGIDDSIAVRIDKNLASRWPNRMIFWRWDSNDRCRWNFLFKYEIFSERNSRFREDADRIERVCNFLRCEKFFREILSEIGKWKWIKFENLENRNWEGFWVFVRKDLRIFGIEWAIV